MGQLIKQRNENIILHAKFELSFISMEVIFLYEDCLYFQKYLLIKMF